MAWKGQEIVYNLTLPCRILIPASLLKVIHNYEYFAILKNVDFL